MEEQPGSRGALCCGAQRPEIPNFSEPLQDRRRGAYPRRGNVLHRSQSLIIVRSLRWGFPAQGGRISRANVR
jgi:hypothetical protein